MTGQLHELAKRYGVKTHWTADDEGYPAAGRLVERHRLDIAHELLAKIEPTFVWRLEFIQGTDWVLRLGDVRWRDTFIEAVIALAERAQEKMSDRLHELAKLWGVETQITSEDGLTLYRHERPRLDIAMELLGKLQKNASVKWNGHYKFWSSEWEQAPGVVSITCYEDFAAAVIALAERSKP